MIRTFENFPKEATCPICDTSKNEETMLVGITGTEDGGNVEASPIHTGCLNLWLELKNKIIFQRLSNHK